MPVNYQPDDEPIAGFRLQHYLGQGTFGAVWKASAPGGAEVAVKFIDLSNANGFRELKALQLIKRLRHPNIVPLMGFWLKDENGQVLDQDQLADSNVVETLRVTTSIYDSKSPVELIVVMGLGDQSLHDRLEEVQADGQMGLEKEELLKYMEDVARAIDFLNGVGSTGSDPQRLAIQHCDIKPQNILLVGGAAQLCDLGLARLSGDTRKTKMAFTAAYGAPECFEGTPPSRSTDQYSLAISYVELRTGELPFGDLSSPASVIKQHLSSDLELSGLSAAEQFVIRRATSKEPSDRYPSTIAFVKELRAAANDQLVIPAPKRSLSRLAFAGLALTLAVTLLAGAMLVQRPDLLARAPVQVQQLVHRLRALEFAPKVVAKADIESSGGEDEPEAETKTETMSEAETPPTTLEVKRTDSNVDAVPPIDEITHPPVEASEEIESQEAPPLDGRWLSKRVGSWHAITASTIRYLATIEPPRFETLNQAKLRRFASDASAQLAAAEIKRGDLAAAEKHVREAITVDPSSARSQLQAGRLMARFDQLDDAIARYGQAIKNDANLQAAHRLRGITYAIQGEVTRAHPDLTEALRLNPEDRTALRIRALVRLELGRYELAIQDRIRLAALPGNSNVILPLQLIKATQVETDEGTITLPPNYPMTLLTSDGRQVTVEFMHEQDRHTTQMSTSAVRPNAKL